MENKTENEIRDVPEAGTGQPMLTMKRGRTTFLIRLKKPQSEENTFP